MKKYLVLLLATTLAQTYAQVRNLHVEGPGDQYGVIQTTSTGSSIAGLELIRGNAFSGTDWRMQNRGGILEVYDGTDNFQTDGDLNLSVLQNGTTIIHGGSDAEIGDQQSGTLITGEPSSFHLSLDKNGIIARRADAAATLLLQTGRDKGNTYINNLSGRVGVGTTAPLAKLGIEADEFQTHYANAAQLANRWYFGASNTNWLVGGGKFVISPTDDSRDAFIVLDRADETISAEQHRVVQVDDPVDPMDAVNLRTLQQSTTASQRSPVSVQAMTLANCSFYCNNLVLNNHDDWRLPDVQDMARLLEPGVIQFVWTSDLSSIDPTGGTQTFYHAIMIATGQIIEREATTTAGGTRCTCVR